MRKVKIQKGCGVDSGLGLIAQIARKKIQKEDDSFHILLAGATGSGKTTLSFWFLKEFLQQEASVDYVALSRPRFAQCLARARNNKGLRYVAYDEADVISTEAMSQWNRDIVKLYAKIRGQRMCHLWCHPNLNGIQKLHIQEVVNVLIYIPSKRKPRPYYVIFKKDLLSYMEKYKTLEKSTFLKHIKKYVFYEGNFLSYPSDSQLWKDYIKLKQDAMDDSIDEFVSKYGSGEVVSVSKASTLLNVSRQFLSKEVKRGVQEGWLSQDVLTLSGGFALRSSDIDTLRLKLLSKEGEI